MKHLWITTALACAWLSACASPSFQSQVSGKGAVKITGWIKLSGEFLIYEDVDALSENAKFPHCISGLFAGQYERNDRSTYDGKKVTVMGELVNYAQLPEEDSPFVARKVLGDSVISNFCLGSNVVFIKSMKLAATPHGK